MWEGPGHAPLYLSGKTNSEVVGFGGVAADKQEVNEESQTVSLPDLEHWHRARTAAAAAAAGLVWRDLSLEGLDTSRSTTLAQGLLVSIF